MPGELSLYRSQAALSPLKHFEMLFSTTSNLHDSTLGFQFPTPFVNRHGRHPDVQQV
ncbi:hypothetical protein JAAARDRAFT_36194 [Jaapia argillacea MUCL 33604]|uniref:Uncharacterized protein n=1 Tax=Jaapia argillacea MUCL 33604 TaxID=933084 RepID=A0A067PPH2_9AGAM|nr:hypothetical protein JAAARDRAFT_36194 [Jaapia argillacea MUCL 33604]